MDDDADSGVILWESNGRERSLSLRSLWYSGGLTLLYDVHEHTPFQIDAPRKYRANETIALDAQDLITAFLASLPLPDRRPQSTSYVSSAIAASWAQWRRASGAWDPMPETRIASGLRHQERVFGLDAEWIIDVFKNMFPEGDRRRKLADTVQQAYSQVSRRAQRSLPLPVPVAPGWADHEEERIANRIFEHSDWNTQWTLLIHVWEWAVFWEVEPLLDFCGKAFARFFQEKPAGAIVEHVGDLREALTELQRWTSE